MSTVHGGWVVAVSCDDSEIRAQDANFRFTELAVNEWLASVVADGVLRADILGDVGEAGRDLAGAELRIGLATCGCGIAGKNIVAHLQREVEAVQEAEDWHGGVADDGGVDLDLVGLKIPYYLVELGLAAVFLAVRDDVDDAAMLVHFVGSPRVIVTRADSVEMFAAIDRKSVV